MKECWIIKVSFLNTGVVNFNEGYMKLNDCILAIKNKLQSYKSEQKSKFIYLDIENNIEYEAKSVTIY